MAEPLSDESKAAAKKVLIVSLAGAVFDAESHVVARHINKSDAWLRRRSRRLAQRSDIPKMASTFTDTNFFDVALAVYRKLVCSDEILDRIVDTAVSTFGVTCTAIVDMPDGMSGHAYVFREGVHERIECHHVRVAF